MMQEGRTFLTIGENNDSEYMIELDYSVIETDKDAYALVGILDRLKLEILDTIAESQMDDEEIFEEDEDDEDGIY